MAGNSKDKIKAQGLVFPFAQYKKEYCNMLIEHMRQGLSYESFGAIVGCGRKTLYNWEKKHPEFLEAKQFGNEMSMLYYEKLLAEKARDSKHPADLGACIFPLKTRFHKIYSEKVTHEMDDETKDIVRLAYKLD